MFLTMPSLAQQGEQTPQATQETQTENARDYCAGQVSYQLPDGWAAGTISHNAASVSQEIASSKATLSKYATLLDPDEASVIIGVFDRKSFADLMQVDASADLTTMLKALLAQPSSEQFTMSDVTPMSISGHPAAQVSGYSQSEYQYVVFVAFDSETLGLVLLSANPNERTRWNATGKALADSLTFDVPRFPQVSGSLPLTQNFSTDDCSVVFGFPEGWTTTRLSADGAPVFKAWITNYDSPGKQSGNLLDAGQARLELQITAASQVSGTPQSYADEWSQQSGYQVTNQSTLAENSGIVTEVQISDSGKHVGDALQITMLDADRSIATLTLYSAPGELEQWRATALGVAKSLQVSLSTSN